MATIALTRPVAPRRASTGISSSSMASLSSAIGLDVDSGAGHPPAVHSPLPAPPPVPNKHLPACPPGPPSAATPIPSPPLSDDAVENGVQQSLLFPPDHYTRMERDGLVLYSIDPPSVAAALDFSARQPLPDPALVFPWFHGLHPANHMQQSFFSQRRRALRRTPCCLRGLTVVKADGQLHKARLKGAIAPEEFLQSEPAALFVEADPREGFSVRNFQIQTAKTAMTSDIVVYGDSPAEVEALGWDVVAAQQQWKAQHNRDGHPLPDYNTFVCSAPFSVFESDYPDIVAIDNAGQSSGRILDFHHQERKEMYELTRASEISHNVWLGPTPEPRSSDEASYDILIECSDSGQLNPRALQALLEADAAPAGDKIRLDFPSSGTILPPTWSQVEADAIVETCKWLYHLAHGTIPRFMAPPSEPDSDIIIDDDDDEPIGANRVEGNTGAEDFGTDETGAAKHSGGDAVVPNTVAPSAPSAPSHLRPQRILIHCGDGYTESTMLGIAYYSYSTALPIPDAWLSLHKDKHRNFFAYPTDVTLLAALSPRLLHESPMLASRGLDPVRDFDDINAIVQHEPGWFGAMDGSFPSRVLDYMYLGNLNHANNQDLLRALGITQILSVGEMATWRDGELEAWGRDNICVVQGVQDNGIDPLTDDFDRCLNFIERGRHRGTATLVHCRVGVSRSATICIAEVMRSLHLSLPRAYCFVRARRLNVIIQPHLRFAYELLKWEELLQRGRRDSLLSIASPAWDTDVDMDEGIDSDAYLYTGADMDSDDTSPCNYSFSDAPLHDSWTRTTRRKHLGFKRELEWGEIAREVALMNQPYVR